MNRVTIFNCLFFTIGTNTETTEPEKETVETKQVEETGVDTPQQISTEGTLIILSRRSSNHFVFLYTCTLINISWTCLFTLAPPETTEQAEDKKESTSPADEPAEVKTSIIDEQGTAAGESQEKQVRSCTNTGTMSYIFFVSLFRLQQRVLMKTKQQLDKRKVVLNRLLNLLSNNLKEKLVFLNSNHLSPHTCLYFTVT